MPCRFKKIDLIVPVATWIENRERLKLSDTNLTFDTNITSQIGNVY
jgi:hypothetical protein